MPTWQNRGFFINDEDQLGGWAMDPSGSKVCWECAVPLHSQVFTLQVWDMVYQTLLRLKGSTIIIGTTDAPSCELHLGTSAFPDEESFGMPLLILIRFLICRSVPATRSDVFTASRDYFGHGNVCLARRTAVRLSV